MQLRVDLATEGGRGVITVQGEIDLATVGALRTAIVEATQTGVRELTLDLDQVTYIDSSGLGTLIGAHKRLDAAGGRLVVLCTQDRILRLFSITGVDRVLMLADPVERTRASTA
jgi:anti-sigma B factor antagonist